MKSYIFRCKTHEAYIIKNLIELLQNNIKTGCFEISDEGIKLQMMDANKRILFKIELESKKFYNYLYVDKVNTLYIGINLNHLYKLLRSIKKKDSLHLFILENDMSNLGIEIIPKEKTHPVTTSYIKIQNIQNLEIILPNGYEHELLISSCGFSKMCKDMVLISNVMVVTLYEQHVVFSCNIGNVYSKEISLGDPEYENDDTKQKLYIEEFDTEIFSRLTKLSALHQNLFINFCIDLPLLIKCNIGNLGEFTMCIKSRKQILENNQ